MFGNVNLQDHVKRKDETMRKRKTVAQVNMEMLSYLVYINDNKAVLFKNKYWPDVCPR